MIHLILKSFDLERLLSLSKMKEIVESLIPFTEKYYDHADELRRQSCLLDYTLFSMQ